MRMRVVNVGRMIVVVLERLVYVPVGMLAECRRVVAVGVMTVVVTVRVLVLDGQMPVGVAVALGQVKVDADREEEGRCPG